MSKPSGRRHQYMNTSKLRVCVCVCVAQLTLASVELYVGSACVCACVCVCCYYAPPEEVSGKLKSISCSYIYI